MGTGGDPEGLMGWVESRCLREAPDKVKPLSLSKEWQASLERFSESLPPGNQERPVPEPGGILAMRWSRNGWPPARSWPTSLSGSVLLKGGPAILDSCAESTTWTRRARNMSL